MNFSINEVQNISFDILKYLKSICDKNEIKYYLAYGTLLGAVRHKGFIPWDDDIDVFISRDNYSKLLDYLKKQPHKYYKLISFDTNNEFTAPLAKLVDTRTRLIQEYGFIEKVELGVYIDLFVLDGIGNSYDEAMDYYKQGIKILEKWSRADTMMFLPDSKNKIRDFFRFVRNLPYKFMGINYYLKKIDKYAKQKKYDDCEYISTMSLPNILSIDKYIYKQDDFSDGIYLEFNGESFCAPVNYDRLLSMWYGEYMKLPPKEKRETHHKYVAYWK